MILEAISTLLTAVSIVFSRLDRHHDAAMATPDLRSGLLQLDGLLEEWLVAAQATNTAATTWLTESGNDLMEFRLTTQGDLADQVLGVVQSPLGAGSDDPVRRDTAPLRRLFEIYAPTESVHITEWAKDRYDLVNQMLDDRQTQAPIQAEEWEAQLRESYDNLRQAQLQLREFIRSSFPLPD